ncbi:MAG TPA: phosphoribosylamine--glycine ligase [Polyangiaceae bacterium]|nr:phosphoribosylamine--glycine ligase [Polyangiaceae bacterium]
MARRRKVLVVGSGGREHALALRLLASESVGEVVVTPGNAGMLAAPARFAPKVLRSAAGSAVEIAVREAVDLVVIGPEVPLCAGLSDELAERGVTVFGPTRAAAQLEGSKAFMKDFVVRHGIRTARHEVVRAQGELEQAVRRFADAPVVKADGLCAGKGVVVAASEAEALAAARGMLSGEAFGDAGKTVVLEERVEGAELSLHALSDGERFVLLPAAQDHKRLFDGDRGPNTGGMGTYAPAPLAAPELVERARHEIFEPALRGMAADGHPFRGVLFAGLMVTPARELVLLEFNVRFGDPETQVMLATIDGDLGDALDAAARGALDPTALAPAGRHAVCIVVAAHGYPEKPRTGDAITGLEAAEALEDVSVLHAGTAVSGDAVVTAGGRVLGVRASAPTLTDARERAYAAVGRIHFEGMQFRRDIAARAFGEVAS